MVMGATRNSRRLLVQAYNGGLGSQYGRQSVNKIDRRIGLARIAADLEVQSFAPDEDVVPVVPVLRPVEDGYTPRVDFADIHEDDEYDLLTDPDFPGWGTAIQWSDLHFFTGSYEDSE